MRLINADEHECWACVHHQNETGKCDTWCDTSEAFELREDVKNAPTAFDVEAVVKELEELKELFEDNNSTKRYETFCRPLMKTCNTTNCFDCIMRKAIEIVRKGGAK